MADWIDVIGDAVFHVAGSLVKDRTPKQTVGIIFGALAAFILIGTIVAIWIGTELDPIGWFVLIPCLLVCISVSLYCLVTGPDDG